MHIALHERKCVHTSADASRGRRELRLLHDAAARRAACALAIGAPVLRRLTEHTASGGEKRRG